MDKITIPDGHGGWTEVPAQRMGGKTKADEKKQAEGAGQQFIHEAGELTERLAKFAHLHCKENGLTPEHLAFAISLLCVNVREDFPKGNNGPAGFDQMALAAQDYYDQNVGKTKR